MLRGRLVVACTFALAIPAFAGDQQLTIERIFSEPPLEGTLPREFHWLPSGDRFTFLESTGEGKDRKTAIWLEDAATGKREALLRDADLPKIDDCEAGAKVRLSGTEWSEQGDKLLLPANCDLFVFDVVSKKVRRVSETKKEAEFARFSPDGKWISFVRDNDLYALDLATGKETRLTRDGSATRYNGKLDWVYAEELADHGKPGYEWSPDSRSLVYITLDESKVAQFPITDLIPPHPKTELEFYPKAGDTNPGVGLGIVDLFARPDGSLMRLERTWDGNATYIPRFGWTPDAKAVWFETLNRAQTRLELVRWDAEHGKDALILAEEDKGWVNVHDDLRFFKDGRILWGSERSGFNHLYMYSQDWTPRALTSGSWEVTRLVKVDEKTGSVYFSATEKSPLDRHLYRVGSDGTGFARLTRESGTHTAEIAPGGRFLIDTFSNFNQPTSIALLDGDGKLVRWLADNRHTELEKYVLGRNEFFTIPGPGGATLHASLLKPADFDPTKKYPVIVYVYGGPHAQVVRDGWGGRYTLFHHYLASKGFLVFSIDNRGSTARGREFERALLKRLGKVELEDQLTGVAYLKTLPYVDGARIGIWGWSYGGFMTCYALTNAPETFKAGAAGAPVTDWRYYDSIYTERYLKLPEENKEGYKDSSPVSHAADLKGALLLIHGTGDDNVHWQNSLAFAEQLYKAGKPYDLQLYANKTHGIAGKDARIHLFTRIADHFIRVLKP